MYGGRADAKIVAQATASTGDGQLDAKTVEQLARR
jgi:hypothetical protein